MLRESDRFLWAVTECSKPDPKVPSQLSSILGVKKKRKEKECALLEPNGHGVLKQVERVPLKNKINKQKLANAEL